MDSYLPGEKSRKIVGGIFHLQRLSFSPFTASLFLLAVFLLIFSESAAASAAKDVFPVNTMYPQASSTKATEDDRVARIETAKSKKREDSSGEADSQQQEMISCSASHIGQGVWLTAKHCLISEQARSTVIQPDGDRASITEKYFAREGVDLALFVVDDSSISTSAFSLPEALPKISQQLTLIGFAALHSYASEAPVKVIEGVTTNRVLWQEYKDSFKTSSISPSRSCGGDSGGAVYSGNEIIAVHSAGPLNEQCQGKKGSSMLHTAVFPSNDWILQILESREG